MMRILSTLVVSLLVSNSVLNSSRAELVAFWPLDTSADDLVGGHNGTPVDGVTFGSPGATPRTGMSASFDIGRIEVSLNEEINPESYTFLAWVRTESDDADPHSVVTSREDIGPGAELYGYILYQIGGNWSHWTGDGDLGCGDGDCWDILDGDLAEVDEWQHLAIAFDAADELKFLYIDGELIAEETQMYVPNTTRDLFIGSGTETGDNFYFFGDIDDAALFNTALSEAEIQDIMQNGVESVAFGGVPLLQPGDADQDLDFDQLDLVRVQIAGKYLTGASATWGEGDWDGGPGGSQGNPPAGDGTFGQLDIIAALTANVYLTGPYGAVAGNGQKNDGQTSIVYEPGTGELAVDAPAGTELTSINVDSAAGIFTGSPAQNLGGSFDNDADMNIFKATFGGSFGSVSFGSVAQPGLTRDFLVNDLTVVGSLAGGGPLGDVDLIYVPEPTALLLTITACCGCVMLAHRRLSSSVSNAGWQSTSRISDSRRHALRTASGVWANTADRRAASVGPKGV